MPTKNIHDLDDTWNNGATEFTAIKMDVTDTASAAGSKLIDLQVGGVPKFKVDKNGNLTLDGGVDIGHATDTTIERASAGQISVEGVQVATASNTLTLTNKTLTTPTINGAALSGSFSGSPNFTGNVGVGVASPGHKLEVAGDCQIGSHSGLANCGLYVSGPSGFSPRAINLMSDDGNGGGLIGTTGGAGTGNGVEIQAYRGGGGIILKTGGNTERMQINSNGNVGIGTASPSSAVHVYRSSGNSALMLDVTGAANAQLIFGLDAAIKWRISYAAANGNLDFKDEATGTFPFKIIAGAASNTLVVDSSSRVGISTVSPTTNLHVNGPIRHLTYTVATLPAAGTVGAGTRAAVTDANATTFNSTVASGGANFVPVISNGTNWRIG